VQRRTGGEAVEADLRAGSAELRLLSVVGTQRMRV